MEKEIFIVDGIRTPTGKYGKSLAPFSAVDLGAMVVKKIVEKLGIAPEGVVDEVIMGNVVACGLGQNPARQAAVNGGLSVHTNAFTMNKVCGSGLKAIMLASNAILAEDLDIVLAGGMESMTNSPVFLKDKDDCDSKVMSVIHDGLTCPFKKWHMGNAAEYTVEKYDLKREELDKFAYESHMKAHKATEEGIFKKEYFPIELPSGGVLDKDETIRPDTTLEKLAGLKPVFKENGIVTAGNSPGLCDGASIVTVASEEGVKKLGKEPRARIVAYTSYHQAPEDLFTSPAFAIDKLLKKVNLKIEDIDFFEINEAFAAQMLATFKKLRELGHNIPEDKVNIYGGAIALGHPIGASGARLTVTMMNVLEQNKAKRGLISLCLGGGGAVAMLIERI